MKKLLLKTLAIAAVLLPLSQVQAKTFGSFQPKRTFTLKVASVTGTKQKPGQVPVETPGSVPAGLPKFKVGQILKFKIGNKGELIGKGFSIPFLASASNAGTGVNGYQDPKKAKPTTRKVTFANIFVQNDVVEAGALTFTAIKVSGSSATTSSAIYGLSNE
ncbi:MAG: hypothetical protein HC845_00120 [Akkermansiaceae bacterium]|nr:hypothetical protein [Akkermansiaceae bacterium]